MPGAGLNTPLGQRPKCAAGAKAFNVLHNDVIDAIDTGRATALYFNGKGATQLGQDSVKPFL